MSARVKLLGGQQFKDLIGTPQPRRRESESRIYRLEDDDAELYDRGGRLLYAPETRIGRRHNDEDELSGLGDIIGYNQGRRDIIGRDDIIGDYDDDDDDDDDVTMGDIIGAHKKVQMGAKLSRKDRKALRVQHKLAKKQLKEGANLSRTSDSQLALALRKADRPIVNTDEDGVMRVLNFPLGTITVPAGTTADFVVVSQESIRCERLFLYPAGGNYDQLFVVNIFAGRQPQSVVPGLEEPMIDYSPTAVNASIEGFTVNFGLTLRITLLNRTGDDVDVSGKIKGRTIT